jgi:hypothetical protein
MSLIKSLLGRSGLAERRKDPRMKAKGLTVSYAEGSKPGNARIGNISPTGLYLITEERWPQGSTVVLTLGDKSRFDKTSRSLVKLWTRCVRTDENGAGLAFAHAHINRAKWLEAMSKAPSLIAENQLVHVFRLTRALGFLFSTSPASQSQTLKLISDDMTRERAERTIELALLADDLLESQSCASRMDVPPALLLRILEFAMEVEEAETREYWARLLAAAALSGAHDDLSLALVKLLSRMNLFHLRILTAAWRQSNALSSEIESAASHEVFSTLEDVLANAGLTAPEEIESALNDLHEFGLLGATERPALCARLTQVNLTLSNLGLRFCERCCAPSQPVKEESHILDPIEQYVPTDIDTAAQEMSNSLASDAQALRETSSYALAD